MDRIFDCFMFSNELDLLELRLSTLDQCVDVFVLVESPINFKGEGKPLNYLLNKERFSQWHHKIRHIVADPIKLYTPIEYSQRDLIVHGLNDTQPNDIILIGDVDEIPRPELLVALNPRPGEMMGFDQTLYVYSVNCKQSQVWPGTVAYRRVLGYNPQQARFCRGEGTRIPNGGWHFSAVGSPEQILEKYKSFDAVADSADIRTYSEDLGFIANCKRTGTDLFGRTEDYTKKEFVEIDHTFPKPMASWLVKYPQYAHYDWYP